MKNISILTVMALGVCAVMPSCKKNATSRADELPEVSVAQPVVDSVLIYKTYPGQLSADKEVNLVARVDGYLLSKNYEGGDYVPEGKVLMSIEDRSYRDALTQAEAACEQAKANLEYATNRYEAMTEALKGDAVSEMEVAQAKSTLYECRAAMSNAEASRKTAATQLSYCTVRAPFAGHVSSCSYSEGAFLAGAAAPVVLATIYDDKSMTAHFSVEDDSALGNLEQNLRSGAIDYNNIPITFSEQLAHKYTGYLSYLAPKINTATGTLALEAKIPNPHGELRSGMFASIDLPVSANPHAILIKDAAIASDQLGKYVYVVNDSDRVVYTPIKTGQLVRDSLRIVESGLSPDDRYVTKALLKVRDGMEVKPVLTK